MTRKRNTDSPTPAESAARDAKPVLTWNDLTVEQKRLLVAISQGEQLNDSSQAYLDLVEFELVRWFINFEADNIDYLTPLGGELLRQREAILVEALEYYTDSTYVTDWGMQEEADNGEVARQALAQVQTQEAHDGD